MKGTFFSHRKRIFLGLTAAVLLAAVALLKYPTQSRGTMFYLVGAQYGLRQFPVPETVVEKQSVGLPVRVKIPSIRVDAAVENVGLTIAGAMDVPKNQDNVAWLQTGSRPGEQGSSVFTGHYGRIRKRGSVFDTLYKIKKGDKVLVTDDQNITRSFVVRELRRYDPTAAAPEVFTSNDGLSHLNLITCEGTWNADTKSYSSRLVVFTDKE